jgi:hypothetical protein
MNDWLSTEELEQILSRELEKYPDECVEMGENWELIAKIFYALGLEAASETFAIKYETGENS